MGVEVRVVQKTTAEKRCYQQYEKKIIHRLFIQLLYSFAALTGIFLSILRVFLPLPKKYGHNSDRHMVYCRVISGGINPVDAKRLYGDKLPESLLPLVEWFVDQRICGIDFSGIVISAPKESGFKPGNAVYGTIPPFSGSFCEHVLAPSDFIALKPKNLTFAEAAVVPLVGLTTLQALEDCQIRTGSHVLVLGASGGTGHFAVQMARAKGAARVTAVCGARNREFVMGLGADEVVCYDSEEVQQGGGGGVGGVMRALQRIVERHGKVDIVFDSVSSHDPRDQLASYEHQIHALRSKEGEVGAVLKTDGKYLMLGGLWHDWLKAHLLR
jgi:NADPH:quinone reductase-like Zn-dependent oxidoreductase